MATNNYVLHKLEAAFAAWLAANAPVSDIAAEDILGGLTHQQRRTPNITCVATEATPVDATSGNWLATATVQIVSDKDKDETSASHAARVEAVADLLATDSIATDLSAALPDFTAFLVVPVSQSFGVDEQTNWVSELVFQVDCCGSDIS